MHFAGIASSVLLQAGAVLGGLVVLLYILKLKRRPIPVPFAPLWQRILRDKEATTLFSQLKRLLSLLLQLALVTALLVALGDPRPAVSRSEGRHVVVLFDASASMKATDVEQLPELASLPEDERVYRTRLDVGRDRIREKVRGLGSNDRMLVAQMDGAITPLSTMTSEISELEKALDAVKASDVRAQYARALRFAVDSLRGLPNPEIIIVSDGALGEPSDDAGTVDIGECTLSHVPVGSGGKNVAVTGFSVRRYPLDKSRYEVLLEVTNTADEDLDIDLELFGDGALTDIVSLKLKAKERLSRFYPNLSGADQTLEAKVRLANGQPDDLPVDDHAFALLPERRRARVQVVTDGNMYLEAALLLDEYLEVTTIQPAGYPADGEFDVTIFDNVVPKVTPGSGHTFYLNPKSDEHAPFELGDELKSNRRYTLGFDELDTKHPLMRSLSLGEVNIAQGRALKGEKGDKAVGKSFDGTLLLAGRRAGRKFVALGFDIRNSDLPLRIAWPLLVLNTVNFFIDEDVDYISSFRTGEVWSVPADASAETATVLSPGGQERVVPIKDGRAVFLGQRTGFYTLTTREDADEETLMFAANLSDPLESAIAPQAELMVGDRQAKPVAGFEIGVRREIWMNLLAAVLLVAALEWLTYHRRLTV
jgi:von Willebrand factor type A domain/Aerotolerance regulator N-terminal